MIYFIIVVIIGDGVISVSATKRKKIEKVINIFLNILIFIFSLILLISIYNNVQINILKNDYSSFFDYSIFEVQTGSMSGTIEAGDWIVVKATNNINLDDIVTYKEGNDFTTHRVIEKYKDTYVTKGDANNTKDEPITKEQIVGKVVKILPHFGILKKTLFNPLVIVALIVTLFLISFALKKGDSENEEKIKNKIKELVTGFKKTKVKKVTPKIAALDVDDTLKNEEMKRVKYSKLKKIKTSRSVGDKIKSNSKNKVRPEVNIEKLHEAKQEEIELLDVDDYFAEEELDKTISFRMIPVAKDEIENTYSKIAETKEEEVEEVIPLKEEETQEQVDDVKHELELLKAKTKKCRNIVEKAMLIKNEELESLIKILNFNKEYKLNEPTIKDTFLTTYIDAKYYNHCGDVNVAYDKDNVVNKIDKVIDVTAVKLVKAYNGSDSKYKDKVKKMSMIFKIINFIEKNSGISDPKKKREKYREKIVQYINLDYLTNKDILLLVNKIIKVQKKYASMLQYTVEKMQTNLFKLKYSKIKNRHIYGVKINHNITFSKVYSDYIIEKTYNEGIVAEDKLIILLNILLTRVLKDMYKGSFNTKYLFYIPSELYQKNNKLNDIFEMLADEYVKNSIYVVIKYKDLIKNNVLIKKLVKEGYHFVLDVNDIAIYKDIKTEFMYIMDYIFVKEENKKIKTKLSKDLYRKIIYDDILEKVV